MPLLCSIRIEATSGAEIVEDALYERTSASSKGGIYLYLDLRRVNMHMADSKVQALHHYSSHLHLRLPRAARSPYTPSISSVESVVMWSPVITGACRIRPIMLG